MYGAALVGEHLQRGEYRAFPVHTTADEVIWSYNPLLRLNLRWNGGDIESQGPNTGEVLMGRRGLRLAMETAGVVGGGTGLGRVPLTGTPTAGGGVESLGEQAPSAHQRPSVSASLRRRMMMSISSSVTLSGSTMSSLGARNCCR